MAAQPIQFYRFKNGIMLYRGSSVYNTYVNKEFVLGTGQAYSNVETVYQREEIRLPAQIYFDGNPITTEQHNKNVASYIHRDNDGDIEYLYPGSKEDYKVYLSKIRTETRSEIKWTELPFSVVDIPEITEEDMPYMEPVLVNNSYQFGLIQLNLRKFAMEYFSNKAKELNLKYTNEHNDTLRFAKIDGQYVCDDTMTYSSCVGDLDSMRKTMVRVKDKIDSIFLKITSKKITLEEKTISDMISAFESINDKVGNLDVMKKSVSDKIALRNFINNKIKDLYAAAGKFK